MEKPKITLIDKNFEGRNITDMPGVDFSWCKENKLTSKSIFITDYCLEYVDKIKHTDVNKIAWLLEPNGILPNIYDYIKLNYKKFYKVLTYDRQLISEIDNGLFLSYGTFWVSKIEKPKKSKLVSMIASHKYMSAGHKLRHDIYSKLKRNIDYYGSITGTRIADKKVGLEPYMFSIAVENCKQDGYFTEKILDCFATKTVPIYWGDDSIKEFFNTDGIITFKSVEDLSLIIDNLDTDTYLKMVDAIEDNFKKIDNYYIPELSLQKDYSYLLS